MDKTQRITLMLLTQMLKNQSHLLALSHIGAKDIVAEDLQRSTRRLVELVRKALDE